MTSVFCWNKTSPYSGCQIRYFGGSVEAKAINQTSRKKGTSGWVRSKINRSEKSKKFVLESRRNVVISELSKTTKPKSK